MPRRPNLSRWFTPSFTCPGTQLGAGTYLKGSEGQDYMFFGFVSGRESEFAQFRLSDLEAMRSLIGQEVQRDLTFPEGRLTDVVPRPKTKRRTLRDQVTHLVSFFLETTYTPPLYLYIEGAGKTASSQI